MNMSYKVDQLQDNGVRVHLSGDISVGFSNELKQVLQGKERCFLSFQDVERLNSIGTRWLVEFVSELLATGAQVFFERCVPDVVEQVNMLPVLSAGVTVISVYANESCPKGHGVFYRLVHINQDLHFTVSGVPLLKPLHCRVCGAVLESEHLPEMYFYFATNGRSA